MKVSWTGGCTDGRTSGTGTLRISYRRGIQDLVYALYDGAMVGGKSQGKGTWQDKHGNRYDGLWQAGLRYGQGAYLSPEGTKLSGKWANGKFNGLGKVVYEDGSYDDGQ